MIVIMKCGAPEREITQISQELSSRGLTPEKIVGKNKVVIGLVGNMQKDALMIEVHPNPAEALSDGAQSLTLERFKELVCEMAVIGKSIGRWNINPQMVSSLHSETELYLQLSS